jgi:hypothetical protein
VIVVDAAFKAKLLAAGGVAELRDETGAVLGKVVADPSDPTLYVRPELDLSDDEVARRLSPDAVTYTTEEVLAYVKGLRK